MRQLHLDVPHFCQHGDARRFPVKVIHGAMADHDLVKSDRPFRLLLFGGLLIGPLFGGLLVAAGKCGTHETALIVDLNIDVRLFKAKARNYILFPEDVHEIGPHHEFLDADHLPARPVLHDDVPGPDASPLQIDAFDGKLFPERPFNTRFRNDIGIPDECQAGNDKDAHHGPRDYQDYLRSSCHVPILQRIFYTSIQDEMRE